MRIPHCPTDQAVPGLLGGSVRAPAVAEGLASPGHEAHVESRHLGPLGVDR